jgi:hypothetical protein
MGASFEGWVILELMGHRRLSGYASEVEVAGAKFLRLDVPSPRQGEAPTATQFYSAAAIYCITPTSEELARQVAAANQQRWELQAPQARPDVEDANLEDDDQGEEIPY